MPNFTIIMDYRGGTFVQQKHAGTVKAVLTKWAKEVDLSSIYGLGSKGKMKLIKDVENEIPMPLEGLKNAWCVLCSLAGGSALINIVRTHEE